MKAAWRILLSKELLDVVRDRGTLVLTIALPVLLYPGILLLMGAIIAAGTHRLKNEALVVAVVGPSTVALLARKPVPEKTTFELHERAEAETLLLDQKIAAIVEVPRNAAAELEAGRQAVVTILYTKRFDRSMEALERVKPVLESINSDALKVRLEARQLEPGFVDRKSVV